MKKSLSFILTLSLVMSVVTVAFEELTPTAAAAVTGRFGGVTTSVKKVWRGNEWEVLRLTNKERMDRNRPPLSTTSRLQKAARVRAVETIGLFSHTRPDGTSCITVFNDFNIDYSYAGENLAAGSKEAAGSIKQWMNSPGHKRNILDADFNHMGAGYTSANNAYKYYWTQMFTGGCQINNISVGSTSSKPVFEPGKNITALDLIVILACSHGKSYMPLAPKMCKGYNQNSRKKQTVTVSYKNLKTSFTMSPPPKTSSGSVTGKRLPSPQGLRLTASKASWKAVKNNNGYVLKILRSNKTVRRVQIKKNRTSWKIPKGLLSKGKNYRFTLIAKGKGSFKNSKSAGSKVFTR